MTRAIDAFVRGLGTASALLTAVMVAVTVLVVVLRYLFGTGAIALQEVVVYAHACVIAFGLAYTLQTNGHVRVDLVYARLSTRTQRIIDLLGHLLFLLPVSAALLYLSFDYVAASWRIKEASPEVGGLPAIYLLKTLIPISAALLLLQGLALIARIIGQLISGDFGTAASATNDRPGAEL
ncbi:MAG: TRAP transporter small permease subunit [Pseudomonadota bacterium]